MKPKNAYHTSVWKMVTLNWLARCVFNMHFLGWVLESINVWESLRLRAQRARVGRPPSRATAIMKVIKGLHSKDGNQKAFDSLLNQQPQKRQRRSCSDLRVVDPVPATWGGEASYNTSILNVIWHKRRNQRRRQKRFVRAISKTGLCNNQVTNVDSEEEVPQPQTPETPDPWTDESDMECIHVDKKRRTVAVSSSTGSITEVVDDDADNSDHDNDQHHDISFYAHATVSKKQCQQRQPYVDDTSKF